MKVVAVYGENCNKCDNAKIMRVCPLKNRFALIHNVVLCICFWHAMLFVPTVSALQTSTQMSDQRSGKAVKQIDTTPLRSLGSEYQNGINLLQNRFRIDYKVDEISMVFFRKFGSAPIVLVKPDGTKIFQSQAIDHDVDWYDAATYDYIRMRNPVPGPWQAVGQILPDSRVMVISDLALSTDELPNVLFSGEIMKQIAYLTNNDSPIDYAEFRDVVTLMLEFVSTNNPNFDNFGAQKQLIASFEDNGKGMDERPLDGTFTGQFNLSIPAGEWQPIFTIKTPMFSREKVGEPIVLHQNPIKVDVQLDESGESYHQLIIDADRTMVDMSSLLIDGKIKYPNGDVQNFSITSLSQDVRTHEIVNYEFGIFRVKITAYGNTIDGRDFILDVPEFTFFAEEPEPVITEPKIADIPDDALKAELMAMQEIQAEKNPQAAPEEIPSSLLLSIILVVNSVLVVIGSGVIWFMVTRKKKAVSQPARNPVESGELIGDSDSGKGTAFQIKAMFQPVQTAIINLINKFKKTPKQA